MNINNLKKKVPLAEKTTFKVGGAAEYYCEVDNEEALVKAVSFAKKQKLPIFILGGGSNVLLSDKGIKGLVIKFTGRGIRIVKESDSSVILEVQAGEVWDDLVKYTVKKKLQGVECLSGIPGTVGAAPVQNIGAYGQEMKDVFRKLTAFDRKRDKVVVFFRDDCQFGYRDSIFKKNKHKGRYIIMSVFIVLNKGKKANITYNNLINYLKRKKITNPSIADARTAVLVLRKLKLEDPNNRYNAGSFFKNPIVDTKTFKLLKVRNSNMPFFELKNGKYKLFAGWLIERAGWKGKKYGNASVSKKNALVIVNPEGKASSEEINQLSNKIIEDIKMKYGVELQPEVQVVGG